MGKSLTPSIEKDRMQLLDSIFLREGDTISSFLQ